MLKVIKGDLFDTDAKYLVHQANCVSVGAAGLAYDIFKRYPYADMYSSRGWGSDETGSTLPAQSDIPGDIIIKGNGTTERYIIALMGQYYPGGAIDLYSYYMDVDDNHTDRVKYFRMGLAKIAKIESLDSVAFPYMIGCGLAQGNWDKYYIMLQAFADHLEGKAEVLIYQKE